MRYCFALDLKNEPALIEAYEEHHKNIWPEILKSIKDSGIENMDIYRVENRLFMIMEVNEDFSLERKKEMDFSNPTVQKWEKLMWQYQQALPKANPSEKWVPMKKIFSL